MQLKVSYFMFQQLEQIKLRIHFLWGFFILTIELLSQKFLSCDALETVLSPFDDNKFPTLWNTNGASFCMS